MMLYLSSADLADLVAPSAMVASLEQGLRGFAQGGVVVPTRGHIDCAANTLLVMPAADDDAVGIKAVVIAPDNSARGLPVVNGLMTLYDVKTGVPAAVLNAAALTAQRTGAIGAIAIKYTTPPDIDSVGVIGLGTQGIWQAIYACAVRPVRTVYYAARSSTRDQAFIAAVSARVPDLRLVRCADAADLLSRTSVIIAATTSVSPVIPASAATLRGKHFISVGSFKPSMQELPSLVYELAPRVVVDTEDATTEVGDLIQPLSTGLVHRESVVHLAALVSGTHALDKSRTTVVKSVGMALYDLYAARALVAEAKRRQRGTALEL